MANNYVKQLVRHTLEENMNRNDSLQPVVEKALFESSFTDKVKNMTKSKLEKLIDKQNELSNKINKKEDEIKNIQSQINKMLQDRKNPKNSGSFSIIDSAKERLEDRIKSLEEDKKSLEKELNDIKSKINTLREKRNQNMPLSANE